MRRALSAGLAGVGIALVVAAPALARDPFQPVVGTAPATTAPVAGGTVAPVANPSAPAVAPVGQNLPNTGRDVGSWIALSAIVALMGAGALVAARMLRPTPLRT